MSDITTLGPATAQASDSQDSHQTTFGRFLAAIRAGQSTEQSLVGGSVVWCDEPVETIALSGIWVIMHKLADIHGMEITTTVHAMQVAERVDRLISAGIHLVYGTPEAAAQAFHIKVVGLVRQAHELGYRPGMDVPAHAWNQLLVGKTELFVSMLPKTASQRGSVIAYWQTPSTLFFATLVKAARALRERIVPLCVTLRRGNFVVEHDVTSVYASSQAFRALDHARVVLGYLDETAEETNVSVPESLSTIEHLLEEATEIVEVFQLFGVIPDPTPGALIFTLDQEWLATQVLLCFTQEPPQADILPSVPELQAALEAMQAQNEQEVVVRTLARLYARLGKTRLTAAQQARLEHAVRLRLPAMRRWDVTSVGDSLLGEVFVHVSDRDFFLDPDTAYQVAIGLQDALVEQARSHGLNMVDWFAGVGMAILWSELDLEDVSAIIYMETLPDLVILDGLNQCDGQVGRAGAIKLLNDRQNDKSFNYSVRLGLIEPDMETFREHVGDLDADVLENQLTAMLDHAASPRGETFIQTFWLALTCASDVALKRFLADRSRRAVLCEVVKIALEDPTMSWIKVDRLRERLGDTAFHTLVLGSLALFRESVRSSPEAHKEFPWTKAISEGLNREIRLRVLGEQATLQDAQKLLRSIPEAQALAWARGKTD